MENKLRDYFVEQLNNTGRDVKKLIEFLDTSDFFTSPASTKFHGAFAGGLAEHSVNVLDSLLALDEMLNTTYGLPKSKKESIIIVALLHDLCKINCYVEKELWRKDANGKWESYPGYVREPELVMGHAGKSVFLAQKYIELSDDEAQAIYWHMGAYDKSEYNSFNEMGKAFEVNSLAYKLHTADMMSTYVLENENIEWEETSK